jgi:hypothetical protein
MYPVTNQEVIIKVINVIIENLKYLKKHSNIIIIRMYSVFDKSVSGKTLALEPIDKKIQRDQVVIV